MRIPALLCLLVGFTSCISTKVTKFPTYDEAVALKGPSVPAMVEEHEVDESAMPLMVQYAAIHASSTDNSSKSALASAIRNKANTLEGVPDLIILGGTKTRNTGMVHVGYGIFSNTSATSLDGWLFRTTPSRLGFRVSDQGLVLAIDAKSNARAAGLLEGDTIVSIDGHEYTLSPKSGLSQRLLSAKLGEEMLVIWVRPGKGQMRGMCRTVENDQRELTRLLKLAEEKERTRAAKRRNHY